MQGKVSAGNLVFSGVLLVLVLALMLVTGSNPIGFSRNAVTRAWKPERALELPGRMARAGENAIFHHEGSRLRKINEAGEVFWEKSLEGVKLLWMGPQGAVIAAGRGLEMWDPAGGKAFEKGDFLEEPEVLSFRGDFLLVAGKKQGKEYAALLNSRGTVLWIVPLEGSAISGEPLPSGYYTVLNILDEEVSGRAVMINSSGSVLWEFPVPSLFLALRPAAGGIAAIAEDRILRLDFEGRTVWEKRLEGAVYRGDIGDDGYIAAVIREADGKLSGRTGLKILNLDPEGRPVWSYRLDDIPLFVKKSGDFTYIAGNEKMLILSREGLLKSTVELKGALEIDVIDPSRIIVNFDGKSSLLKISAGR
ncbi:hypothetical protein [Thermoanaerobacterium sp. DL9XJH110]|uniref:hypothetical protein n=1 Tax=Thermoanaerobacterium sp. DL9XJH110 TaxID=3386643 RepID=UPI003BB5304F